MRSDANPRSCPNLEAIAREQLVVPPGEGAVFSVKHVVNYAPTSTSRVAFLNKGWSAQIDIADQGLDATASGPRQRYIGARDTYKRILLRMFGSAIFDPAKFLELVGNGPFLDANALLEYGDAVMELAKALDAFCRADTATGELVDELGRTFGRGAKGFLEGLGLAPWMLLVGAGLVIVAVSR